MKKTLTALVILGGIVGAVAYKLKNDEKEKDLLDQELEILSANDSIGEATNQKIKDEINEIKEDAVEMAEDVCDAYDEISEMIKKELAQKSDEVIEALKNDNDVAEEERPIQHYIDFKNEEDMEAFKAKVIEKGYVVSNGEKPLELSVLHIAPIKRSELLANVYYLTSQALKFNGSYQGWQSRKVL